MANDGTEAVKKARDGLAADADKGYVYCLVFMDLSMPVMDGYEATEALRVLYSHHQQPRIIACTGHVEHEFIQKAWRFGMDELCSKPLQAPLLESILEDAFE